MFPPVLKLKTITGILFSIHKDIAVASITFKPLFKNSRNPSLLNFTAFVFINGSDSYMPSTFVALRIASAFSSIALKAAAVSVVK